jgi:lambda repressor-like predicted transcriptional regulator
MLAAVVVEAAAEDAGDGAPAAAGEGAPARAGDGAPARAGDGVPAAPGDGVPAAAGDDGPAPGEQADRLAFRLGADALVAHVPPFIVALVPAPPQRRELELALRGRPAALGPAVPWEEAAVSFARAREVLRLAREGGIDDSGSLLMAETHRLSLLLGADRRLAREVADAALAPLASETDLSRERLRSTLDAWLRHRGRTEAVAKALHVHPQTVRYRLARLRELFGSRLDDPDGRFELELALRARRIAG